MDAVNFEKYISERGLDYVAMPANCYSFNMEELDYSSAETYKIINLQLNTNEIEIFEQTLEEGQTCVLPIMLTSTSDSILADKKHISSETGDYYSISFSSLNPVQEPWLNICPKVEAPLLLI